MPIITIHLSFMKKIIVSAIALTSILSVSAADPAKQEKDSVEQIKFTDIISLPVTSVKNQSKSGTCWCFAGTSFFENEIRKATGDSLDLSEMYSVRHCYADKADKFVRTYGNINFAAGGSVLDVPYVWQNYGAVPEEVYQGLNYGEDKHTHGELDAALSAYVKAIVKKPNRKSISTAWREGLEGILDAYLGKVPETFTYKGKTYTPQSFAQSLGLSPDNYIALTSFTHHPFYKPFALEVSDNWLWGDYQNVPLDELRAIVDNALANGYTVVWAADVSEPGFKWKEGKATIPVEEKEDLKGTELSRWVKLDDDKKDDAKKEEKAPEEITVTQESRQAMFDRQETTDDHGMEIVGLAEDKFGNKYYKVKNSWGTDQCFDGFLYVSMPYFDAKTMDIYVNKKAVPKDIAKKLGI